jgi:hypothetical protein
MAQFKAASYLLLLFLILERTTTYSIDHKKYRFFPLASATNDKFRT